MKRRAMRGALAAALCAAALLGACGGNSGPQEVEGTWEGTLTLRLAGGGTLDGPLTLVLDQDGSFASGGAEWAPIGETQGIAGPIDGIDITLRLLCRCAKGFETTELKGTVDGDSIEIDSATGLACTLGGKPTVVEDGSASLSHTSDGVPL